MKKFSQKIFLLAVISLLIIPQVTFAAWWNPFTWKIFHRSGGIKIEKTITPPAGISPVITEIVQPKADKQTVEIEKLKKKANPVISTPKPSVPLVVSNETEPESQVQAPQPVSIEVWESLEARFFVGANQKGWTSLTITNALGEKRYYRKEGIQWIRKNTQVEAEQSFITPQDTPQYQQQTQTQQQSNLLDNLLQSIIKSEFDNYQKYLAEEKIATEKSKPLWDQIKQIEDEELQKGCVNPGEAMSFITGQKWSECNKLSLDKTNIADQIAIINHTLPYVRPLLPPPPQSWIIDRTTKTISTQDGSLKYYYTCTSAECRINPY